MIIFIGDKPSAKNIDPNIPFLGTQSYITLMNWVGRMQIHWECFDIINKDTLFYCRSHDPRYKYVALGNEAEKLLKKYELPYFKLPHPSGRNRKLNDKKWLSQQLSQCSKWLQESKWELQE